MSASEKAARMVRYYENVIAGTRAYLENPPRRLSEADQAGYFAVIAEAEAHRAYYAAKG